MRELTRDEAVAFLTHGTRTGKPATTLIEQAPDLLEWATRIARRYVPAGRAEEFGRRNAAPEELLVRLRMERAVAQAGIAD